jgi:hypothetical protein
MPAQASVAVNEAIRKARLGAGKKQVWLVYQINEEDTNTAIGTLVSHDALFGEVYQILSRGFGEVDIDIDRILRPFSQPGNQPTAEQLTRAKLALQSAVAVEENVGKKKSLDAAVTLLSSGRRLGAKELKTVEIALRSASSLERRKVGAFAKDDTEEIMKNIGEGFPARHAEENFIDRWGSLENNYKTKTNKEVTSVNLYLNFSPCVEGSEAKKIDDVQYPQGCLYKLKTLANKYNKIHWAVHYDKVYEKPSPEECRQGCITVQRDTPNLKFWKLSVLA